LENDRAGKVKKKKKEAEDMEQELLQEIASYWGTRAEGYSEVNEKELAGSQREAWLHVLEEQFPEKKKEEMKILDIGTGPGFFPMILSEAGYTVAAVDYTEEMLEKAKENLGKYTKYGLERVTLQRMDAQNLEFVDETFDVVISRNLTWNLEKPEQAYQEWMRVLKPGGVLLNFDANWYGYLYDEEKKEAYEADRKKVEEQQLDDHYLCTDIDRMENIARQVPLSAMERPAWDTKVLESLGVCSIQTDSEIWKRVWSEEERLNYASTPMFLVRAEKSAEQSFQLGDVTVRRGEKYQGDISFANGDIVLPGTIICGKLPGKTMLITGGVHSGEYVGIQACVELGAELQPEKTVGTIVILKVLNRPAFENRAGSLGLSDGKNLNRVFPGNPNGTEMERLAWAITKEVYPKVDYYIDLHSGDDFEALTPYVYYAGKAAQEVTEVSRKMAEQVDVPYMVRSMVSSGGAYNYAASKGIASILLERGGMGAWTSEEVNSDKRDVRNILSSLDMYQIRRDVRNYVPMEVTDVCYQAASEDGLWYPAAKPGNMVAEGALLGTIRDYNGKLRETCRAEYTGVVLYQTGSLQVTEGGPVVAYGRIVREPEYDDRKEQIVHYWEKRSESFLEQRRSELANPIAKRWMKEIEKQIPAGRRLKILDVGCGAGFFSILLAKEGHEVFGIDLTPEMIENAIQLAEEENADCCFQVMDAENPMFADETFDVVISRNLTWTLPNAEHAYGEWMRVLKTGGVLLNFDANYGKEDVADTKGLPEAHAHFKVGNEMLEECERIKSQLPISRKNRPAYDVAVLCENTAGEIRIDTSLGKRIYLEKDELYNPAPMFSICAVKQ
jgi:ubiquinone/menaquinone biosynthesis C-methylase UbiE/predicted deacylase